MQRGVIAGWRKAPEVKAKVISDLRLRVCLALLFSFICIFVAPRTLSQRPGHRCARHCTNIIKTDPLPHRATSVRVLQSLLAYQLIFHGPIKSSDQDAFLPTSVPSPEAETRAV